MKWQPIETAPKDGTRVLAYWPDCYGNESSCQVESWFGPVGLGGPENTWQNPYEQAYWHNRPTHWKPLDAPPGGDEWPTPAAVESTTMKWQPIETAPKDGTIILVATWELGPDMASAAWNGQFWDMRYKDTDEIWSSKWGGDDREFGNPTHWMPLDALPEPPND